MSEKVFREKSLEQLSSPEELTSYLRVTGPGVWVTLAGVLILLAGLFYWGMMGTIITTVTVPAKVEKGKINCYVLAEDAGSSDTDVEIDVGDVEMKANAEHADTKTLNASDDQELYKSGYLSAGKNVKVLTAKTSLTDGYYDAKVTIEKLKPISLLFSGDKSGDKSGNS